MESSAVWGKSANSAWVSRKAVKGFLTVPRARARMCVHWGYCEWGGGGEGSGGKAPGWCIFFFILLIFGYNDVATLQHALIHTVKRSLSCFPATMLLVSEFRHGDDNELVLIVRCVFVCVRVCVCVCVPYGAVVCAVDFQSRGCRFNSRRLWSHTSFFSFSFS